jgi:hypothetical protein
MHTCDNPLCVEPTHLRIGTQRDNVLDMYAKRRHPRSPVDRCLAGHDLSGDNLIIRSDGHRDCRVCRLDRAARGYAKRKANPVEMARYATRSGAWRAARKAGQ